MAARQPPYLLRLKVTNFRSLRHVEVRLAPLNVLVGPNGAGKSNLLDVIAFLGDATRDDLERALELRGGLDRVLFRGSRDPRSPIGIEVDTAVTGSSSLATPDTYSLTFSSQRSPDRHDRYVLRRAEEFMFRGVAGPAQRITIDGRQITFHRARGRDETASLREGSLGLSTLPKLVAEDDAELVEELADLFASFRVFDVDVAAARRPSQERISERLSNDASNLAPFLAYLAQEHPDRFAALHRDARSFIPGLASLEFTPIGGGWRGRGSQSRRGCSARIYQTAGSLLRLHPGAGVACAPVRSVTAALDLHRRD